MNLEIKKVAQQEFDVYWTPEVCNLLNQYIQNTKWWAIDFDGAISSKKWIVDQEGGISFMGVDVTGAEHPSQLRGQDVAVVAMDGSVGLLKHIYDQSFHDVYKPILLTGRFAEETETFKLSVLAVVRFGGLGLDGYQQFEGGLLNPLTEKVTFEE